MAVASEDEPHVVMEFLLSVQQFDLAAEWAEIHVLPKHFHEVSEKEEEHLGDNLQSGGRGMEGRRGTGAG